MSKAKKNRLILPIAADRQFIFLAATTISILAGAALWTDGQFIGIDNLQSMGSQLPEIGLLSIGIMVAMISGNGGIDLSGVALANLSGVIAAQTAQQFFDPEAAVTGYTTFFILTALIVGVLGGVCNGLLIARLRLTAILATLGTQLLFTGIAVVLTDGSAVRVGDAQPLAALGNETLFNVPIPFVLFTVVVLSLGWILRRSLYGVRLYLLGTNPQAAIYAGISPARMLVITYGLGGLLAAMAGLLIASRTASVKWDYGSSYLLMAILIAVMAGVKPAGGHGNMSSLFLAAVALQLLSSAFNLAGISSFFSDCAWGALLLMCIASSQLSFKRRLHA